MTDPAERVEERVESFSQILGRAEESAALLVVDELRIFEFLMPGPATLEELATRASVAPRRLSAFLDQVVALGFLEREQERYRLVDGDRELFDPEGTHREGLGQSDLQRYFGRMGGTLDVLRSDRSLVAAGSGGSSNAEQRRQFMRYLHSRSVVAADEVAELLCTEPVRHFADLGCGLGTYSVALASRALDATGVLVDRPNGCDPVLEFLAESGMTERLEFLGGDFLLDDFGDGFDLVVASNILHVLDPDRNRSLIRRAAESLAPGGRLALKDIAIDDDRLGPPSAVRFRMAMARFSDGGNLYSKAVVGQWLGEAGLQPDEAIDLEVASGSWLIVARRRP